MIAARENRPRENGAVPYIAPLAIAFGLELAALTVNRAFFHHVASLHDVDKVDLFLQFDAAGRGNLCRVVGSTG
jgi:hypothetical protein